MAEDDAEWRRETGAATVEEAADEADEEADVATWDEEGAAAVVRIWLINWLEVI